MVQSDFQFIIFIWLHVLRFNSVFGYNFHQRQYNDVLTRKWIMLDEQQQIQASNTFRQKRDAHDACSGTHTPGPFVNCCDDGTVDGHLGGIDNFEMECFNEIRGNKHGSGGTMDMTSCDNANKTKNDYLCITQCVGQRIKLVDSNGILIESNIRQLVLDEVSPSEWKKAIANQISEKCYIEATNLSNMLGDVHGAGADKNSGASVNGHCNPSAMQFTFCIWREFIKACPKNYQSKLPQCVQLMNDLKHETDD